MNKFRALGVGAALAVALAAGAAPALADTTTPGPLTAKTHVTNRLDSGNGGNWAVDSFDRTVQLSVIGSADASHCAGHLPCVHYSYKLVDGANGGASGGFYTIPGALAPNQGPGHTGQHVQSTFGSFIGSQSGDFYTSMLTSPAAFNVPGNVSGNAISSSRWPTLEWANPDPGKFYGLGAKKFSYSYTTTVTRQKWIDAGGPGTDNCDGNCPLDGQIIR